MRYAIRSFAGLAGAVLVAAAAAASQPAVQVRLQPRRLGVRDLTRLSITITGGRVEGPPPKPSRLKNLQIVGGPSTSQEFSWVNGVSSSRVTYSYVLQPLNTGPAEVGPVTVSVGGRTITSAPISAVVVAGSVAPTAARRPVPSNPFDQFFGGGVTRQVRVGLRLIVPRLKVYQGQCVPVTIALETTAGINGFQWSRPPTFPGWWAQRVTLPEQVNPSIVQRNGVQYRQYPVARYVLVPLKPGKVQIPPVAAHIGIRSYSLFEPSRVIERSTPATTFTVIKRPPAPPGYSGAVGRLTYRARVSPEKVRLGGSIMLSIELSGRGNLPLVDAPAAWPGCSTCETFSPEESSKVIVDASGIHGTRTWTRAFIPRQWGTLHLPAIRLAVFDPDRGSYVLHSLGPFTVEVLPPPTTPTPAPAARPAPAVRSNVSTPHAPVSYGNRRAETRSFNWIWLVIALGLGVASGLVIAVMVMRSRRVRIPRPRAGQTPADRARQLQAVVEGWWAALPERKHTESLAGRVDALRRELEAVRFAPGRADHSQTVVDLEAKVRTLLRGA
ncbi:MAG: protein BatD [Acidobacteria bacterium]|nr:protein BatD [Acidobacteriota bacterium]